MKEPIEVQAPTKASSSRVGSMVQDIENYQAEIRAHRKKLEEVRGQLRDSYTRYTELYELAPVGFLTLDRKGRIRELNGTAARLLGFAATWLIDRPFVVFVAKEDVQRFLTFALRSIQNLKQQQTIELDIVVEGRHLAVQLLMRTSTQDGVILHRLTIIDLTDLKRTESQLQDSLDNWHSLVQNAPDVIMTIDRSGKILFVNRPVWGYSVRALMGTRIDDYVAEHQRSRLRECIETVFTSDERSACDMSGVNGDSDAWFGFSFGPVQNGSGRPKADRKTTVTIREISEHKRAEETLRSSGEQLRDFAARLESVREEERTRVAREIHDELGQALTILKLDLSWLQTQTPRTQRQSRKKIKSMMDHVDGTIELVRKIASELRPSILDDLGLIPAIEWQLSELQKRTGIRCSLRSKVEKPDFGSEKSAAVFRVVQEALTNVVRHAKASAVLIGLREERERVCISIVDTGKGITEAELGDPKSLGIVGMKERIARLGGELTITSRRGNGTRLDINLPIET